jgi:hypothetical protein
MVSPNPLSPAKDKEPMLSSDDMPATTPIPVLLLPPSQDIPNVHPPVCMGTQLCHYDIGVREHYL